MSKAENDDSGCSCGGCGCFLIILALGIAFNVPAVLDFILKLRGIK